MFGLNKYAIIAVAGLVAVLSFQQMRLTSIKGKLVKAEAKIEAAEEAAIIHRAHIDRQSKEIQKQREADDEIDQLQGGNDPLSDYLSRGAGILYQ